MQLFAIETGRFKLDGGAMFGVVPRSIWQRTNPPDANNLIDMALRCLLVQEGNRLVLIDTGIGTKVDEKFRSLYDLDDQNFNLDKSLLKHGFTRSDITDVVLTHLHFDHCGGATAYNYNTGDAEIAFQRANIYVHGKGLEWALNPNPREQASFFDDNLQPLLEHPHLIRVDANTPPPIPGMSWFVSNGHTEGMICPIIEHNGYKVFYGADFIPTHGHIPLPYVMSYDVRPLVSMEERAEWLPKLAKEKYVVFLEHDPGVECCTIQVNERGKFGIDERLTLANLQ